MGMHWGEMEKNLRGVIIFSLSPYEQKAFKNIISKGLPNMIRRIQGQWARVLPPFVIGAIIYDWAKKEHEQLQRKNPKDYRCDE